MSRRPELLPDADTLLLRQCEAVVDVELGHLWKLQRALELIESQQLYRPEFDTFEAYLATRWPKGTFVNYLRSTQFHLKEKL
jgi:hypothetical protein